jgi:hypothetical protein
MTPGTVARIAGDRGDGGTDSLDHRGVYDNATSAV